MQTTGRTCEIHLRAVTMAAQSGEARQSHGQHERVGVGPGISIAISLSWRTGAQD